MIEYDFDLRQKYTTFPLKTIFFSFIITTSNDNIVDFDVSYNVYFVYTYIL